MSGDQVDLADEDASRRDIFGPGVGEFDRCQGSVCVNSIKTRRRVGMSPLSHMRPSTYGDASEVGWVSVSPVDTTAQPASACTSRIAACADGSW